MSAIRDRTGAGGALANCVGRKRAAAGVRQQDLASRVGISRQTLSVIEAGQSVPSAAIALRLARSLGCPVEDLFWVDGPQAAITVEMGSDGGEVVGAGRGRAPATANAATRVVLASIDGRWVAHRLAAEDPSSFLMAADGVIAGGGRGRARSASAAPRVTPFADARLARDTLLCAGCAPAFGLLAARANTRPADQRVLWLERSSGAALELLARAQVHVAGTHLYDEEAREFNVPFVRRRFPGRSMLVVNLARWEAGLVVARGNPRRIRGVRDLARADVSFVRRLPGAAAQDLIDRLWRREGLGDGGAARTGVTARGHMEVARLVALGVADAGVALPAVARAHDLDFIPLAEERFDLVLARELRADPRVVRLLETLSGRAFRHELESLGGHVMRDAGRIIADTSPRA
ncbi:MAG: substrate-binding domain-containing protein [Bacteroidota bacterium]